MYSARTLLTRLASCAVLLLAMASIATAQMTYSYLWDNSGGNNNWGTGTNWGLNAADGNQGVPNFTPNAYYEERGLINNGDTVNVTSSQTQFEEFGADNVVAAAGVTVDGVTAPGNGSKLNIASGGSLSLLTTYGLGIVPPGTTRTAGTGNATLNNGGMITVQPGGTLTVKGNIAVNNGSLTVGGAAAGGTVTASNLNLAGADSAVSLLGSATLNVANGAVLNGTATITGPNVVFSTPSISMASTTVFSPVITSAAVPGGTGHSVIDVAGGVSMNGTLRPQFQNGVVPHLGDVWTLWDSAHMQGNFAASDATGAGAALPTGLRYAITTMSLGSARGVKGQLTVENFLSAEVDRANGQVTIQNTDTTVGSGVEITGYQIGSAGGTLKPAAFTSPFGGAWQSANLTANSIGELNPSSSSVVGLGASSSIGAVYDPVALQTTFGTTPVSDVTFSYTRSDGRTVNGPVTYVNEGLANTFVLQVDPTDGKARIVNDSVFDGMHFDGYQVTSASNSLLTGWHSLQDQSAAGWEEAAPTTSSLAELNSTSSTTVDAGQTAAIMTGLFKTAGGTQDLTFQFRAASPISAPPIGDYNGDNVVNAADYTVWRNALGQSIALPNEDPGTTPGSVTPEDYTVWKNNFGNTQSGGGAGPFTVYTGVVRYEAFSLGSGALGSAQVPEPSTFGLAMIFVGGILGTRCRVSTEVKRQMLCPVPLV